MDIDEFLLIFKTKAFIAITAISMFIVETLTLYL